jgi:hypothetical protein
MKYYILSINDSGAIEDSEENIVDGLKSLKCKIYDDDEFNSLNDILHSLDDYIINEKTLKLFKKSIVIPFELTPTIVTRKESKFGIFNSAKSYNYVQLKIKKPNDLFCYNWIDFEKSEIKIIKNGVECGKLNSHQETLNLIKDNYKINSALIEIENLDISDKEKIEKSKGLKTSSWITKKIVFNKSFDYSVDLFEIPFYSWGTYISERLKISLITNNITDIGFAETKEELGIVWKPHFPVIEFL